MINWDRKGWPGSEIQMYYVCPWLEKLHASHPWKVKGVTLLFKKIISGRRFLRRTLVLHNKKIIYLIADLYIWPDCLFFLSCLLHPFDIKRLNQSDPKFWDWQQMYQEMFINVQNFKTLPLRNYDKNFLEFQMKTRNICEIYTNK